MPPSTLIFFCVGSWAVIVSRLVSARQFGEEVAGAQTMAKVIWNSQGGCALPGGAGPAPHRHKWLTSLGRALGAAGVGEALDLTINFLAQIGPDFFVHIEKNLNYFGIELPR